MSDKNILPLFSEPGAFKITISESIVKKAVGDYLNSHMFKEHVFVDNLIREPLFNALTGVYDDVWVVCCKDTIAKLGDDSGKTS